MLRAIPSRRTGQPRYHFRRIVPALLRPLLGKTEISLVLHTSDKLVARERAAALYARTGQLFRAGKMQHPTKDDLLALYRDLIDSYEAALKAQEDSAAKVLEAERAQHLIEKADLVTKQSTFLNTVLPHMEGLLKGLGQLRHTLEKREVWAVTEKQGLQNQITTLCGLIQNSLPHNEDKPDGQKSSSKQPRSMKLSAAADKFVFSVPSKSAGTIKGTGKTVALFTEAFGDIPVHQITGDVVGEFYDLLSGLPTTHGKGKVTLPLRDAVREAEDNGAELVSGKTVKNHFSRMSAIWSELVLRDLAPKNPWANWSFDLTQKTNRRAWSEDELRTLLTSKWLGRVFPERTYRGIVRIALYTGMRLGEICNLRNEDIEVLNGIPCFHIRPHTVEIDGKTREWSPKTSAGTRIVPIHSKLLEKGILEEFRNAGPYFFSELPISNFGVRGANFELIFSKHKRRLNLPTQVTFHSFRHLVSTVLRNQDSHIRELWIDDLLGHEATHKSQGTTQYTSAIYLQNLQRVVEAITYPDDIANW